MMRTFLISIWRWFSIHVLAKVTWNWFVALFHREKYYRLTEEDREQIKKFLSENYYVILIRRNTHLSTYLINFANWILTGKWGYWSHVLFNFESGNPTSSDEFRLYEATSICVHYSTFDEIFDCDAACLMVPKGFTPKDWTETLEKALTELGKPYDTLYDLSNDQELSCVELVYDALEAAEDESTSLVDLKSMISKSGNLTPQMFYECKDFDMIWEIRR